MMSGQHSQAFYVWPAVDLATEHDRDFQLVGGFYTITVLAACSVALRSWLPRARSQNYVIRLLLPL